MGRWKDCLNCDFRDLGDWDDLGEREGSSESGFWGLGDWQDLGGRGVTLTPTLSLREREKSSIDRFRVGLPGPLPSRKRGKRDLFSYREA